MGDLNWMTDKATVRPTGHAGFGAFADCAIARGEIVAAFGGAVVTRAELDTMPSDRRARSLQIDDDLFLAGAQAPEPAEYVNHSCEPSCALAGSNVLIARRDIEPGEELTYDYATSDGSDYDEFACGCGARRCRGVVSGQDWAIPELQLRYRGEFSPYLARRISRAHEPLATRRAFAV